MKDYFQLQFILLNRKMIAFGLPLWIGYSIIPIVFFICSTILFSKLDYAIYIYLFLVISLITLLSEPNRNDFLKSIYNKKEYRKVRILENLVCALPFLLFLIYKGLFLYFAAITMLVTFMALFRFNLATGFAIPTPFGKKPFEYLVGFRNTFFIFPMAYALTFISIQVGNFNLAVFSLGFVGLICLNFYSKTENEYFVWNYSLTAKQFLIEKVKTSIIHFTILSLPIVVALLIFFFSNALIIGLVYLACIIYLVTIVFAKYSAFPNNMNVVQGILIGLSLMLPPLLLVFIPLLYNQSVKKLKPVLA